VRNGQLGIDRHRAQIREQPHPLAQCQQTRAPAGATPRRCPTPAADRTQEDGIGFLADGQVFRAQWHAVGVECSAADGDLVLSKPISKRFDTASIALTAWATISGPTPSPGMRTICARVPPLVPFPLDKLLGASVSAHQQDSPM